MKRNDKNGRVMVRFLVVTAAVYLAFRYLLPLIFPFVIAFLLAVLVRPVVRFLHARLRFPNCLGAVLSLSGLLAALIWGIGRLGTILLQQAADLAKQLPVWIHRCSLCLDRVCGKIEQRIALEPGVLATRTKQVISEAGERISEEGMSLVVENSAAVFHGIINAGIVLVFIFIAAVLFLTGEERSREAMRRIPFREEIRLLKKRVSGLGRTYIRCELLAIALTCVICVIGLWIIGNPYALLIGITIGILDALPLFGTGTILIPWAIFCFIDGSLWRGIVLLLTYGVGYVVHQLLETRLLGESMGTTPLMTLVSLYVGMELFGLAGLVLGPAGYMLIREILVIWNRDSEPEMPSEEYRENT